MAAAAVSATPFELAPGYVQLTCTVGGVISGYWATGRMKTAMLPISTMITEIPAQNMGGLIKNFAKVFSAPANCRLIASWRQASLAGASGWEPFVQPAYGAW